MIVYLPHGAFGATKMTQSGYLSKEFPVGDSVSSALKAAISWEKHVRGGRKAKPTRRKSRIVEEPRYIKKNGSDRVVVPYIDKHGNRRSVQKILPYIGAEEAVQQAIRRACIMAGCPSRAHDFDTSLQSPA